MSRIKVKGFKIFNDRHGKTRCYHRTTGHKIDLDKAPLGSAEFFAECAKISAVVEAQKEKAAKPGTLGSLIATYKSEEHFAGIEARVQYVRRHTGTYQRHANSAD
jgi:hypothetical protein